jgi:hypothetical protein
MQVRDRPELCLHSNLHQIQPCLVWILNVPPKAQVGLVATLWDHWGVVEYLGDRAYWEEIRSLEIRPQRGYWDSGLSLLPGPHKLSSSFHHTLPPWCTDSPQAQKKEDQPPWIKTSKSMSQKTFFLIGYLSQIFCHSASKLTGTGRMKTMNLHLHTFTLGLPSESHIEQ